MRPRLCCSGLTTVSSDERQQGEIEDTKQEMDSAIMTLGNREVIQGSQTKGQTKGRIRRNRNHEMRFSGQLGFSSPSEGALGLFSTALRSS